MKNKLKTQDISSVPKLKKGILKMWTQDISTEYPEQSEQPYAQEDGGCHQETWQHDQILVFFRLEIEIKPFFWSALFYV
jgi:hypothetical protein